MAETVSLYFAGTAGLVVDVITKEQLQAMSDFEVNKALAKIIFDSHGTDYKFIETKPTKLEQITKPDLSSVVSVHCDFVTRVDFCNIPNDVMPLAFEHKLSLHYVIARDSGYWMAGSNTYYHCEDVNSLRAIACCLILVLQEQSK